MRNKHRINLPWLKIDAKLPPAGSSGLRQMVQGYEREARDWFDGYYELENKRQRGKALRPQVLVQCEHIAVIDALPAASAK